MGNPDPSGAFRLGNTTTNRRGFTILEALVTIAVISVIGGIVIPSVFAEYRQAHLANCIDQLQTMRAVALELSNDGSVPNPTEFWTEGFPDAGPGEYYYIVGSQDAKKSHDNNLDRCNEDTPLNSPQLPGAAIKFVVLCNHDHKQFGKYVYATDQDAPTVVEIDGHDPGYRAWLTENTDARIMNEGKDPKPPMKKKK